MNFDLKIKYQEGYLPTKRHRKLRYKTIEEVISVEIKEINKDLAPIAFRVDDCEYRLYNDNLYRRVDDVMYCSDETEYLKGNVIEQFKYSFLNHSSFYGFKEDETREVMLDKVNNYLNRFVIIDDTVWRITNEPRYVIHVFGLGNNHGGTSLSVTNCYNPNISNKAYFNANEREKAVNKALDIAIGRGDTKYVDYIKNSPIIEVLMPNMVKCNPKEEHIE